MPITVNVKATAGNKTDIPTMTKFQQPLSPSFNGNMMCIPCEPNMKVSDLKKAVALKTMAYPEQLMYSGNVMEDGKKLSDYDINKPMGVYDYIWINSAENQATFAKDLQFHKGDLKTKYHYLREKFQGSCWSF
eukprot:CAMPEP_0114250738 /NCGR_PEP_ID=MMETSP0058-20121206/14868_1 /TAXON_ID=36894 /ORGANISM="Pyramimonas parkeae, CCMP726" /LENGTH=132 /DNA_ID=CAMNT_0001364435 /DNA_START=1760 /DNA_END=2158 /DNA_ORIENTATION=+